MKQKILIPVAVITVLIIAVSAINHCFVRTVDLSKANKITINYTYGDVDVHTTVTNKNDFEMLKKVCKGKAVNDFSIPSCGFGTAEIIFSQNGKDTYIYPACDECDSMRFGKNDTLFYFIGEENRDELENILHKYGITFPCV